MAQTPEGKVKKAIKEAFKILKDRGIPIWYHMPVQNGMGSPTLDFIVCLNGKFISIEAKAPGKSTTARQDETIASINHAGGTAYVCHLTDPVIIAGWLALLH